MLLAIDAGNTNTVFALIKDGEILHKWRISTASARTPDEYMVWISQLMAMADIERSDVSAAIIASVVPSTVFHLLRLCEHYFAVKPLVVGDADVDLGIEVKLPNPNEVGADRLVNAVAGFHCYPQAQILIDFGTATTFDVVGDDGNYHGGVIAPGINLSVDALHAAAAKLPKIAVEPPQQGQVIGKSTIEAMQSGVMWGYIGLIEGLVDRITAQWGKKLLVVATGGLAPLFESHSAVIDKVDRDLTLMGLHLIHQRNKT